MRDTFYTVPDSPADSEAAALEADRDPVLLDLDRPAGLDEATVQLLRCRLLEPAEP